jgi:hypothetical protein
MTRAPLSLTVGTKCDYCLGTGLAEENTSFITHGKPFRYKKLCDCVQGHSVPAQVIGSCKFCFRDIFAGETQNFHQDLRVCEGCWDERLRNTQ